MATAPLGPTKRCPKCGCTKPATTEFFRKYPKLAHGLACWCKCCDKTDRDARIARDPDRYKRTWAKVKDARNAKRRSEAHRRHGPDREQILAQEREFRRANREKIKARADAWRKPRQAQLNARERERYENDPSVRAQRDAYGKEWRERNREKSRSYVRNRRARIKGNGGVHTANDIERLKVNQRGNCYYCATVLSVFHVDHVIPIARGGSNDSSNIVLACPRCNQTKADKLLSEWKPERFG